MRIYEVIWFEHIVEKLWRKHEVHTDEVMEVFDSRPRFRFLEKGHRQDEDVYVAQGRTDSGRYLSVFFVHKGSGQALVISAREMTKSERKMYERT
jgi:uncharacterized DUF497 family protein